MATVPQYLALNTLTRALQPVRAGEGNAFTHNVLKHFQFHGRPAWHRPRVQVLCGLAVAADGVVAHLPRALRPTVAAAFLKVLQRSADAADSATERENWEKSSFNMSEGGMQHLLVSNLCRVEHVTGLDFSDGTRHCGLRRKRNLCGRAPRFRGKKEAGCRPPPAGPKPTAFTAKLHQVAQLHRDSRIQI